MLYCSSDSAHISLRWQVLPDLYFLFLDQARLIHECSWGIGATHGVGNMKQSGVLVRIREHLNNSFVIETTLLSSAHIPVQQHVTSNAPMRYQTNFEFLPRRSVVDGQSLFVIETLQCTSSTSFVDQ